MQVTDISADNFERVKDCNWVPPIKDLGKIYTPKVIWGHLPQTRHSIKRLLLPSLPIKC